MTRAWNYLKQHPELAWLAAIMLLSTALRLAFLHEPFERDEGQYASIAQEILRGGLPYRDAIEIKPPGTFYLYALAISLFGASTEGIRIFTALYALGTLLAVYGVARLVAGRAAGLWAALVFGIFSTFPLLQGSSSNTEVFLVLPLVAGVWCLLKAAQTGERSFLCWCGLCGALAMLIKPVALPVLAMEVLLLPWLPRQGERAKACALDLVALVWPMVACALATLLYFSSQGALGDLLYWTVEFPRRYRSSEALGPPLLFTLAILASTFLVPVLLGIPSALWLAVKKRGIVGVHLVLMILAAWLAIVLPGKYFPHYFITMVPFLAVPAGVALAGIARLPRVRAGLVSLLVLAAFAFSVQQNYRFYLSFSPETVSVNKYGRIFVDSLDVARYLRQHTVAQDYIFQWGLEPELYFLADRRCPNPFLVSLVPGWSSDPEQAVLRLKRSLLEKKPAYIVLQSEWANQVGIEEVSRYLDDKCTKEADIAYATIFRCSR
jgi:4-amino-4-deoxy-L-arabinose transferase-like glycosyltransferase